VKISVSIGSVRPTTLGHAIDSIRRQTWADWELLVVGQGPDPALRAVVQQAMAQDHRIRYLHLDRRGLSLARNVGAQAAEGDVIAFTDDDCEARDDWLATLARCFTAEPDVDVVGGALLAPAARRRGLAKCPTLIPTDALYDPVVSGRHPPAGWDWYGGNFALRASILKRVGPFDECFGVGARFRIAEDTDYKLRLEALDIKMRTTPRSVVFHTFGYRYGFRSLLRRSIDASWGHGALAGKLTLFGDRRGRELLIRTWRQCTVDWLRWPRPDQLPLKLVQLCSFTLGYQRCVRDYQADQARGVLQPLRDRGLELATAARR
jgi:glycosyltransferase involved in cell wall biosynthesis